MKFLSRSALALALGITAASVTPSELAAQSAQIGENNIFCALVSGAVVSSDSNAPIAGAAISRQRCAQTRASHSLTLSMGDVSGLSLGNRNPANAIATVAVPGACFPFRVILGDRT
jgi:hypothetical protein